MDPPSPSPSSPSSRPLTPLLTTTLLLTLPLLLALYIHTDYAHFLSLGPGGTPSTPLGYTKLKLLSLLTLRNRLAPLPIPPHFRPQTGRLAGDSVPARAGPRPVVAGIAPQRQRTQRPGPPARALLAAALRALARDPRNRLVERPSCFESHSTGLFACEPIIRICAGEVCHAHPSDGSLHLALHPADARVLLEKGWGERHPLARGGWFRRFVPREFVLVYAPRTEGEVAVVMEVVAAAVWWVSGVDVAGGREGCGKGVCDQ